MFLAGWHNCRCDAQRFLPVADYRHFTHRSVDCGCLPNVIRRYRHCVVGSETTSRFYNCYRLCVFLSIFCVGWHNCGSDAERFLPFSDYHRFAHRSADCGRLSNVAQGHPPLSRGDQAAECRRHATKGKVGELRGCMPVFSFLCRGCCDKVLSEYRV